MNHSNNTYDKPIRSGLSAVWLTLLSSVLCLFCSARPISADPIKLKGSDYFELVRGVEHDTVYTFGSVKFAQDDARLECDSAVWVKDQRMYLWGNALFDDGQQRLEADSIVYDLTDSTLYAVGDSVVMISFTDSIRAVGEEMYYSRIDYQLELLGDPHVEFGYPDTIGTRHVSGQYIRYNYQTRAAMVDRDVVLIDGDSRAVAECALFDRNPERIRLYENAAIYWERHELNGDFVSLLSHNGEPQQVDVWGGGVALFRDVSTRDTIASLLTTDSAAGVSIDSIQVIADSAAAIQSIAESGAGVSRLSGRRLRFLFEDGDLREVDAYGKAYSHYEPRSKDQRSYIINDASGDSIQMFLESDSLRSVNIFGSAEGVYTELKKASTDITDTLSAEITDTVTYSGERIYFDLRDSTMALGGFAAVSQQVMNLQADSILYITPQKFVRAFAHERGFPVDSSADTLAVVDDADLVEPDSSGVDSLKVDPPVAAPEFMGRVILVDGSQEIEGTYVEYSMETNKGVLRKSATQYDRAYYTGGELYRQTADVFYVDEGSYTTCEFESPHFHFWSKEMKVINDDKMIAKPVVFYIEKIPLFIIPYYVFPMRDGRRSGLLNFRFGNFNQGGRFIRDVGYYWAASEYWDYEGWMDYYETSGLTLSSAVRYAKRYQFNGNVQASYSWDSQFERQTYTESFSRRWRVSFDHRHTIDPTFSVNASGSFLSDTRYLQDFSDNLSDRLQRNLRSQVNFSKRLGVASFSGSYIYDKDLDREIVTKRYPNLSFRLPSFGLFGAAERGEEPRWYHTFRMSYSSRLNHLSDERNKFETLISAETIITPIAADTTIDTTIDSLGAQVFDTTITVIEADTAFIEEVIDTSRTSKSYTTYSHSTGLGPNFTVLGYFPIRLGVSYSETLFKISETDQSRGIVNTAKVFRTYSTSLNASVRTTLYGTVRPNLLGLKALRHEMSPSANYTFRPAIVFDDEIKTAASFAGVGAGNSSSQSVSFGLSNTFRAKLGEEENERVVTLLTLSSGISYNPDNTDRRWSNLTTSFSTSIAGLISLNGGLTHSFYANGGLESFDISTAFSTSGNFGEFYGAQSGILPDSNRTRASQRSGSGGQSRSWSLRLNHFYSENRQFKSHFLNVSLTTQLTRNLSLDFSQRYDFTRDVTVNRYINLRRRLHCWEGVFTWTPTGSNQGYFFKINVIDLPDIKYEKSLNSVRGRGILGI